MCERVNVIAAVCTKYPVLGFRHIEVLGQAFALFPLHVLIVQGGLDADCFDASQELLNSDILTTARISFPGSTVFTIISVLGYWQSFFI